MLSQANRSSSLDLMQELKTFISGAKKKTKCSPLELTKTALSLLKNLPASRDAVLEYFCSSFDVAAQNYIVRLETEIATGKLLPVSEYDDATVTEIHTVLCNFVSSNAEAWAPIISTWSLELLGEISTKYVGRAHVSKGLNETLQLWMNCRATRTLIDITTQCLSCLMNSDTEACINALLDTSVKHSPNFDWVVAHVGSCFPNTVITRVLSCGLKDFCQNKSYEQGCDSPKLKSAVGILGHLAGSHGDDIRAALINLFILSLEPNSFHDPDSLKVQKRATVPFLLQLTNLSPTLLSAVCKSIKQTVSLDVIVQLYNFIDDWCKHFGSQEALENLIVSLVLKCESGGSQIVNLLLDCIFMEQVNSTDDVMKEAIKGNARVVLAKIIFDIDSFLRQSSHNKQPLQILKSFVNELEEIHSILLHPEKIKCQTGARIIIFMGHNNPCLLINSCKFLFQNAMTDEHLALLVRILTNELVNKSAQPYCDRGGYFSIVLEELLTKKLQDFIDNDDIEMEAASASQMWSNLLTLLKWEKSKKVQFLNSCIISRAIENNLLNITKSFEKERLSAKHTISKILNELNIPKAESQQMYNMPVEVILNFTMTIVKYFFACCHETDDIVRLQSFCRTKDLLKKLCLFSKVAKTLALKELLERALFSDDCVLFGSRNPNPPNHEMPEKLLLKQNKKISKTIPLTKHSSVYNGGIIGSGKKKPQPLNTYHEDVISGNTNELISALRACCSLPVNNENKFVNTSLESVTLVSLQLVQIVSPDVMYNGLPWPEEEFSKVTIERDLHIRRLFANTPLLWHLLTFVAINRPALCYCSVLIRALTATLIHQWGSMGDQSKSQGTDNYKALMDTTVKVIDVMSLAQLLPPPLSDIRDILPFVNSNEIVSILKDCVWAYMRDHVPSPALFTCDSNGIHWRDPSVSRPPDIYTNTLRLIMQRNIEAVSDLFAEMFINIPTN